MDCRMNGHNYLVEIRRAARIRARISTPARPSIASNTRARSVSDGSALIDHIPAVRAACVAAEVPAVPRARGVARGCVASVSTDGCTNVIISQEEINAHE